MKQDIITAHKSSIWHRDAILKSDICGCFFCLYIFPPSEIKKWTDYQSKFGEEFSEGQTALCPRCTVDSVIGSSSGYPIEIEFLDKMKKHWFDE